MTEFKPEHFQNLSEHRRTWLQDLWNKLPDEAKVTLQNTALRRGISIGQAIVLAVRLESIRESAEKAGMKLVLESELPVGEKRKKTTNPFFITEQSFNPPTDTTDSSTKTT